MLLRTRLHGTLYEFRDLRVLMGKANEEKPGFHHRHSQHASAPRPLPCW